jgi:hypothetical protein
MRKYLLILIVFVLFACGDQPSTDLIREDFQRIYPKGEIVLLKPLEKSSDMYRVVISYRPDTGYTTETEGKFQEDVFLYKKIGDKWVNTWRKSSGR